jgi:hypothetical protein
MPNAGTWFNDDTQVDLRRTASDFAEREGFEPSVGFSYVRLGPGNGEVSRSPYERAA